jgi:rhodanese-related sulfurtransferase
MNEYLTLVATCSGMILIMTAGVTLVIARYRRAGIEMSAREFFTRMLRSSSYTNLGPAALQKRLELAAGDMSLVDLRSPDAYAAGHISGATHSQFDDFLKALVVDRRFDQQRHQEIVLICDTGHMSRVAAEIMVEDEGFVHVSSLRGGMKGWQRWAAAQQRRAARCCGIKSLSQCPC